MNKHTPGPWTLNVRRNLLTVEPHICNMRKSKKANAQLIAAAPDLLDALERAYLQCIEFLNEGDFKRHVEWDAGYIVDAIAKAKGVKNE